MNLIYFNAHALYTWSLALRQLETAYIIWPTCEKAYSRFNILNEYQNLQQGLIEVCTICMISVPLYWMTSFYFLKDLLQQCEACHCDQIGISNIKILYTIHLYTLKCSPWNLPTWKSSCHGRLQKKEEQILDCIY